MFLQVQVLCDKVQLSKRIKDEYNYVLDCPIFVHKYVMFVVYRSQICRARDVHCDSKNASELPSRVETQGLVSEIPDLDGS